MRSICLAAAFALTAQSAVAQCTGPSLIDDLSDDALTALAERVEDTPYPRGTVWELTRGDDRITLVGTVHIHDARLAPVRDSLLPDLTQADVLLTEITPAEESDLLRNLAQDRSIAFITEGPTLVDRLPADQWDQVQEALSARGVPSFMGAQMQPWYLMLTLALPPCAMTSMAAGQRGLDHMLMTEAEAIGVPNLPLEGWQDALDVFRVGTEEEHLEMLDLFLSMDDMSNAATTTLLDLYFAGDIAMIWELQEATIDLLPLDPEEAMAMIDDMEDALLIQRNQNWMPVIAENTALHDNVMIAVGAAHLPGEYGLLNLLANDGWTPVQLSSP